MIGAIDIVILAVFAIFFILGFIKGFWKQLWSFVVMIGALAAAIFLARPVADMLAGTGLGDTIDGWLSGVALIGDTLVSASTMILTVVSGIALFLLVELVGMILRIVVKKKRGPSDKKQNIVNRLLGGAFKCVYAFILISLLMSAIGLIGKTGAFPALTEYMEGNVIANWFYEGQWLEKLYQFVLSLTAA